MRLLIILLILNLHPGALTFKNTMLKLSRLCSVPFREASNHFAGELSAINETCSRRIRYSGKYPKVFAEKYKEKRGDPDTITKVISKGGTPAGRHIPVMVKECMEALGLSRNHTTLANNFAVDCTVGYGGHSSRILQKIVSKNGTLIAIDQDFQELFKAEKRLRTYLNAKLNSDRDHIQSHLIVVNDNFENLCDIISQMRLIGNVNYLLADLGYSSMQIDDPDRGFSFKYDGELDMRMNLNSTFSATTYLSNVTQIQLSKALSENSDEQYANEIAKSILGQQARPRKISELCDAVRNCYMRIPSADKGKDSINKAITRVMQAIRIEVNGEFKALDALLQALPSVLAPGGRVAILTFHSGEDRRVKKAFKSGFNAGIYSSWSRDVVRAGAEERRANARSKCAKLRCLS